jgi:hypothetical protein
MPLRSLRRSERAGTKAEADPTCKREMAVRIKNFCFIATRYGGAVVYVRVDAFLFMCDDSGGKK